MLPDGAEAFWLAFVALLAYECLDKQGPFELRLVQGAGGWTCRLPALRIRDGYLAFHGPLDWLRVELCVNWLRVKDVAPAPVARTATPQNLHALRWPIGALALALLVVFPLVAGLGSVANWAPANLLLVAIGLIYGSAAWLAWSLGRFGAARTGRARRIAVAGPRDFLLSTVRAGRDAQGGQAAVGCEPGRIPRRACCRRMAATGRMDGRAIAAAGSLLARRAGLARRRCREIRLAGAPGRCTAVLWGDRRCSWMR